MACWLYLIRVVAIALTAAIPVAAAAQPTAEQAAAPSTFRIYLRSFQIGTEEASVTRTAAGWTIIGSGRIGPPLDVVTRRLEIKYDSDWKPLELTIDATTRDLPTTLHTTVNGAVARNEFTNNGAPVEKTDQIDPRAVLIPNPFFAPYEALAARLASAAAGSTISLYTPPFGSATATVGDSTQEQIQTVARLIQARLTRVTLQQETGQPVDAEIWGDETGRLLRVSVPAQGLEVIREDISSVSSRRVTITRSG